MGNLWDHLSKTTLRNFVLECRRTPTLNLKQLWAEDIFSSYSVGTEGNLVYIPENTHSFLILVRTLLLENHYSKIKYVQDFSSKMECLLKLFCQVKWINISAKIGNCVSLYKACFSYNILLNPITHQDFFLLDMRKAQVQKSQYIRGSTENISTAGQCSDLTILAEL